MSGDAQEWRIEAAVTFQRDFKHYEKKRPDELSGVMDNLNGYFSSLGIGCCPQQITGKYIHREPSGIKALDQGRRSRVPLQETRLYVFPDESTRVLHLIAIGDKQSQKKDVEDAKKFVAALKKGV